MAVSFYGPHMASPRGRSHAPLLRVRHGDHLRAHHTCALSSTSHSYSTRRNVVWRYAIGGRTDSVLSRWGARATVCGCSGLAQARPALVLTAVIIAANTGLPRPLSTLGFIFVTAWSVRADKILSYLEVRAT